MPTCHPEATVRHYLEQGWWGPKRCPCYYASEW